MPALKRPQDRLAFIQQQFCDDLTQRQALRRVRCCTIRERTQQNTRAGAQLPCLSA